MQLLKRILVYGVCIFAASAIFGTVRTATAAEGIYLGAVLESLLALFLITAGLASAHKFTKSRSTAKPVRELPIKFNHVVTIRGRKIKLLRGLIRFWVVLLIPILSIFFYYEYYRVEDRFSRNQSAENKYFYILNNFAEKKSDYEYYEKLSNESREKCFARFRSGNLNDLDKKQFRDYEDSRKKGEMSFHPCALQSVTKTSENQAQNFPFPIRDKKQVIDPEYELRNARLIYEKSRSSFYRSVEELIILTLLIIFGPPILAIFLFFTGRFAYRWIGAGFRDL